MNDSRPDESVRPRALRLSTILVEIREEAAPAIPDAAGESGRAAPRHRPRRKRIRVRSNITIGEILDRTRQAGFGFVASLLALIAIPFVGLSTPFGLAVAAVGLQMIAGLPRPWLPKRIRRHTVTMATLEWLGQRLARWTKGLERVIRPRFTFMVGGPFWTICGIGLVVQGLGLALPLPIPGSNWVFVLPIILYGIGLLESDGLLIMACHAITMVEIAIGTWLWELIVRGLVDGYRWCAGFLG